MIKMISKSLALLALLFLSFCAVAQEICIPQIPNQTYDPFQCPVSIIPGITNQSITTLALYTGSSASIINASGNPVNSNSIAQLVNACGQPLAANETHQVRGSWGSQYIQLQATGATGWVKVRVYYDNGLGGSTTREYNYFFFNPSSYNGNNPTSFSAAGSSFCPAPYTNFTITRSPLPIFKYEMLLQEVDATGQLVSGGVNWTSGTVYTSSTDPGVNLTINPQSLGFTCQANKRYKVTLKNTTPCGANFTSSGTYTIGNCTPTTSLAVNGVTNNNRPTFCSSATTLPITINPALAAGTVQEMELQLADTDPACGLISSVLPGTPIYNPSGTYDLRSISQQFNTRLNIGTANSKYFQLRARVKSQLGWGDYTNWQCFKILNSNSSTVADFNFTATTQITGTSNTLITPTTSGFVILGDNSCGLNFSGSPQDITGYRLIIKEVPAKYIGVPVNDAFHYYDSGVIPVPDPSFFNPTISFNTLPIQNGGNQTNFFYFYPMTAIREQRMFTVEFTVMTACGSSTKTANFKLSNNPADHGYRPLEEGNPNQHSSDNVFSNEPFTIRLSPVPVDAVLHTDILNNNSSSKVASIIDLNGKVLVQQSINDGNTSCDIDCSELPAGLYIFAIQSENGEKHIEKFIKQ